MSLTSRQASARTCCAPDLPPRISDHYVVPTIRTLGDGETTITASASCAFQRSMRARERFTLNLNQIAPVSNVSPNIPQISLAPVGGMRLAGRNLRSAGQQQDSDRTGCGAADTPRIFIVDDEMFVAWDMEGMVQELQFEVGGIASNGEEAVLKAAEIKPDLVLMDINLGSGIDGVEAARRISATHAVPVIFISAYNDAATRERIRQAVPHAAMLPKPVTIEALRAAIARSLGPRLI